MINLDDYFNSPINDEEKKFIEKIMLGINQINGDKISFNDALLLLRIRNRVYEKTKERELNLVSVNFNNEIAKLVKEEIANLSNEFDQFKNKRDQIMNFIQYIFSIKEMK